MPSIVVIAILTPLASPLPASGRFSYLLGPDGVKVNFFSWLPAEELAGTAGRAVDHVGFEVRDLEAFCRRLEAKGIELAVPYHRSAELGGIGAAVIVDPWGTVLELTEGLRDP